MMGNQAFLLGALCGVAFCLLIAAIRRWSQEADEVDPLAGLALAPPDRPDPVIGVPVPDGVLRDEIVRRILARAGVLGDDEEVAW